MRRSFVLTGSLLSCVILTGCGSAEPAAVSFPSTLGSESECRAGAERVLRAEAGVLGQDPSETDAVALIGRGTPECLGLDPAVTQDAFVAAAAAYRANPPSEAEIAAAAESTAASEPGSEGSTPTADSASEQDVEACRQAIRASAKADEEAAERGEDPNAAGDAAFESAGGCEGVPRDDRFRLLDEFDAEQKAAVEAAELRRAEQKKQEPICRAALAEIGASMRKAEARGEDAALAGADRAGAILFSGECDGVGGNDRVDAEFRKELKRLR